MNTRIPTPLTSLVGRSEELTEIHARLSDTACRLLTLVGPGGIGKTRLALEFAGQATLPDGVYVIALQPLASPDLIIPAVADALQFQFLPGYDQKQQLVEYLSAKSLLLVLDNFEHLLAGAELLSDILTQAPGVKILVTSRERLNLLEEWVIAVEGLSFPEKIGTYPLEDYGAIQLFVQRVRQVQAKFSLELHKEVVLAICQGVEGMPLGLELAASWLRVMSPAQVAEEIAGSLDILTTPLRNVPLRHRSIRAVFDHSWHLLSEEEQRVMSRLAVFHGGFTAEVAASVAEASPQNLAALVDKSLLKFGASGRFDLHPLVRQYAQEQRTPDETSQAVQRHSAYYLEWLAHEEAAVRDGDYVPFLPEVDNLRAAWSTAVHEGNWALIQKAANSLFWFYNLQSRFTEGSAIFRVAIEQLDEAQPEQPFLLGCLLLLRGNYLKDLAFTRESLAVLERGLSLWKGEAPRLEMGTPLAVAALSLYNQSASLDMSESVGQRALDVFEACDEHWGIIYTLNLLSGIALDKGDFVAAHSFVDRAIQLNQDRQYMVSVGWAHQQNGLIFDYEGLYADSLREHELALSTHESIGFRTHLSVHYVNVGASKLNLGEIEAAFAYIDKGILIAEQLGNNYLVILSCLWRALAAFATGDDLTAVAYYDRALSLGNPLQDPLLGFMLGMEIAVVAMACERYEFTIQIAERYMDAWIRHGFQLMLVTARTIAGFALAATGSDALAAAYLSEALAKAVSVYSPPLISNALCGIGWLTTAPAEHRIRLLSFIYASPRYTWLVTRRLAKKALAGLEATLSADVFQNVLEHGAALDLPQAVALANEILAAARQQTLGFTERMLHTSLGTLTPRELEVLLLVADGLTNAEIAGKLYIGVSTVKRHINHIYDKLDVKNRTQAVARAREQRLIF